ncbi:MAG: enoyl-CoA hydratase/isomerase family protein, partial [Thermoguttaceae bacterium]|nr:enoyl-CoA hydratase/isomerase family protein [Thermoguttaceae bacterium]
MRGAGTHFCSGLDLAEATVGSPIPFETLRDAGLALDDFRVPFPSAADPVDFRSVFNAEPTFDLAAVSSDARLPSDDFPTELPRCQVAPRLVLELLRQIRRTPKPIVAAVRGAACGGGAGLVSVCDFVVADSTFRAAFTETRRGLSPSLLFPFLRRKFPLAALQEFVLTAAPFDAARAAAVGFVQTVSAPADFESAV